MRFRTCLNFRNSCTLGSGLLALILLLPLSSAQSQWLNRDPSDAEKQVAPSANNREENMDNPEAAFAWFYGQRGSGGAIPALGLSKAIEQRDSARAALLQPKSNSPLSSNRSAIQATTLKWRLVGPSNIDDASTHAGRVNTLVVHPTDPNTAWLGAAFGGIWKTTNGGKKWNPLSDHVLSLAMGALAIDPTNPNTLYAGTGEFAPGVGSYFGMGMMKSTDGGVTWRSVGLSSVKAFSKIIVVPDNPSTIYAAGARSGGGLYRSVDAGETWSPVQNGLPQGAPITDIAYAKSGGIETMYAALQGRGIYRSKAGEPWSLIHTFSSANRMHVAVSPVNPNLVGALAADFSGGFGGLDVSLDGGDNWQSMQGNLPTFSLFGSYNQGWYDAYLTFDPKTELRVFVGGISIWESNNLGDSWSDVGHAYDGGVHPDQHGLFFAPSDPNVVYAVNDGGVWPSTDGGSTYTKYDNDLSITQFYDISIDQSKPDLTYGGTQDNGTLSGGSKGNWTLEAGGDGSIVEVDEKNPNRYYFIQPGAANYPIRVEDGSRTYLTNGIGAGDRLGWIKPLLLDQNMDILYFGTTSLYVSTNHGTSWMRRSFGLTPASDTIAISALAAFGDGKNIAAATSAGTLWTSTNNGITFTDRTAGLPSRWITSLRFGLSDPNVLYATESGFGDGHIFKSLDFGATWNDISANLPNIPANKVMIDPTNEKLLYLATDVGVFFSPNGGDVWMAYGDGLPNTNVMDIEFHRSGRVIRAGTHGRSIWEADMVSDLPGITAPLSGTIWTIGSAASIAWRGFPSDVSVDLSADGGGTWRPMVTGPGTSDFAIASVSIKPTQAAMVRVISGSDTVYSALFQIIQQKAGSQTKLLADVPYYVYDLAYDKDDNVLWFTNYSTSDTRIYKMDPDNGKILGSITLGGIRNSLTGIKYDAKSKHLFVHQAFPSGPSNWYEVTTTGTVLRSTPSLAAYGTGILVRDDTLFLVERNPDNDKLNKIYRMNSSDVSFTYADWFLERTSPYGPRAITYDPIRKEYLLAYTDFQGNNVTYTLYDSHILRLSSDGVEQGSYTIQEGGSDITNIRGLEYDPRGSGNSAWVSVLSGGASSSQILKLTLVDGPTGSNGVSRRTSELGTLLQSYPNPTHGGAVIPYSLVSGGVVQIRLIDALGRIIYETPAFAQQPGEHSATIALPEYAPSGTYQYELVVNGARIGSRTLTLVR